MYYRWVGYAAFLTAIVIAGLEILSSFVVPPWPARELRPIEVAGSSYNSWGTRDRERSIAKPAGSFRSVLVGDSFLEGGFVSETVGERIEDIWRSHKLNDMQAINLGISATGPSQYYYRIKNVALELNPDAIVLVFFAGNDFVSERLSSFHPAVIAERPLPSLLGAVAPRLTWLVVNRLGLSEFGAANPVDDHAEITAILALPRAERLDAMVRFVKKWHFPEKSESAIRSVLSRIRAPFWDAFEPRDHDQEHLEGWILARLVDMETGAWPMPLTPTELERSVKPDELSATMTWLMGARDLARKRNIPFAVALAPSPGIDPAFVEFWGPWPRYLSYFLQRAVMQDALRAELQAAGVPLIDLADDLRGVGHAYRLTDGHWTELGTTIAAKRMATEVLKLHPADIAAKTPATTHGQLKDEKAP